MDIFISIIKSKFTFFQMQIKSGFRDAVELKQSTFDITANTSMPCSSINLAARVMSIPPERKPAARIFLFLRLVDISSNELKIRIFTQYQKPGP